MRFPKLFLFGCFFSFFAAKAQDTLVLNLQTADRLFLETNFYLLASSLHIEAQKAQIIQAKVYPNPIFTADINAYDPGGKRVFHVGPTGQKVFQIEQLILLGGKRKSEIEMAKTNAKIAEFEFQQLLLQLKFRLHSDLFAVGQLRILLSHYTEQLNLLETLLTTYMEQSEKGNIPLKDVVRLKGAYLKLNNERAALLKDYFEIQNSLQTLLQTTSIVAFAFSEEDIEKYIQLKTLREIQEQANQNRPELQIMENNKILAEQYLQYQKRLAVPDINLFTSYDQQGGAFNHQINVGISVPLPLWDRNQGNIQASRFKIQEVNLRLQALQNEINIEIQNAFLLYTQTVAEYEKVRSFHHADFEVTMQGMTDNFQKQNVSIIEFIDFFEAYNDVLNEQTRIKTQLVNSAEQINLLTGTSIF